MLTLIMILLFAVFAFLTILRSVFTYSIFKYIKLNYNKTYVSYFNQKDVPAWMLLFVSVSINITLDALFTKNLYLDEYLAKEMRKYKIIVFLHVLGLLLLLVFFFSGM